MGGAKSCGEISNCSGIGTLNPHIVSVPSAMLNVQISSKCKVEFTNFAFIKSISEIKFIEEAVKNRKQVGKLSETFNMQLIFIAGVHYDLLIIMLFEKAWSSVC